MNALAAVAALISIISVNTGQAYGISPCIFVAKSSVVSFPKSISVGGVAIDIKARLLFQDGGHQGRRYVTSEITRLRSNDAWVKDVSSDFRSVRVNWISKAPSDARGIEFHCGYDPEVIGGGLTVDPNSQIYFRVPALFYVGYAPSIHVNVGSQLPHFGVLREFIGGRGALGGAGGAGIGGVHLGLGVVMSGLDGSFRRLKLPVKHKVGFGGNGDGDYQKENGQPFPHFFAGFSAFILFSIGAYLVRQAVKRYDYLYAVLTLLAVPFICSAVWIFADVLASAP